MFTLYTRECILSIENVKIFKLFSRKHFHNTRKNEQNKKGLAPLCREQFSPGEIPCFFECVKPGIKAGFLPSGTVVFPFFNSPFMLAALTIYGRKGPVFLFVVPFPHNDPLPGQRRNRRQPIKIYLFTVLVSSFRTLSKICIRIL